MSVSDKTGHIYVKEVRKKGEASEIVKQTREALQMSARQKVLNERRGHAPYPPSASIREVLVDATGGMVLPPLPEDHDL